MKLALALSAVVLAGCGTMDPLTPEQAAVLMYMNRPYIQPTQTVQPIYRPVYAQPQQAAPAWPTPAPRQSLNCTTTNGGYSLYTTCR
jgi:hypothetical protein